MSVIQTAPQRFIVALLLVSLSFTMIAGIPADTFPEVIFLPNGFQPEGIATGRGNTFYVGSIPTGAVYRGDLRTGKGEVLVPAQDGRRAIGLKFDKRSGLLFAAGGTTGYAYIYNGETGANAAEIQLTAESSFINDVVVTKDAAYFTDSFQPVIYRVPLEKNGQLTDPPASEVISLGGDYQFTPGAFNANGIAVTPNGRTLFIVNSSQGALYSVDPATGEAALIDLGTGSVSNGDGILLHGKTLYVVQNTLNQVAVVKLESDFNSGTIEAAITSPLFRVPTTIARFGGSLYVVNARFGTPPTPDTEYEVVLVPE
ncbi:MAG: SMP-30/gluconolactonase/LRE family protein [Chloroflexi bacterium]|nr:SMP-30/gluconolactonase/LRE family protein [Chloroflexota bacterium]